MTTQEIGPDEAAVRAKLHRLGFVPAGHDANTPADSPAPAPPRPDPDNDGPNDPPNPAVPASRLPDWRDPHKPTLGADDEDVDDAPGEPAEDVDGAPEEPADSRRRRVLKLVKGEPADDGDEPDDVDEDTDRHDRPRPVKVTKEPADDQDEDPGEDDDEIVEAGEGRGRRFRIPRSSAPSRRPPFSTPVFPRAPKERKSFAQAWREIDPSIKWLMYHGSGFVGGLAFGVVSFATDVTRSVAESPLPLRENPDAYFWGAGAVIVLAVDRATRSWARIIHWCARGVTTSLLIGALLHGNTIGDWLHSLPTLP
ncbi:hypothetical protein [Streptomyces sp. BSE6.1]|uniref:hypothetical protein n=1 Tax=Streptomyces sp. BSE6.1 TaxID=2605730 RepID=UPI001F30036B|nr:hypothetical protein [Streptomyces sp. BSE6.1]